MRINPPVTGLKGHVNCCNDACVAVSGHAASALLGQPHQQTAAVTGRDSADAAGAPPAA